MKKAAFTLIEMMVSITILSIMMLFLYKSYSEFKNTNLFFQNKATQFDNYFKKKKTLYLDFSLALHGSVKIFNQDKHTDIVFMQTSNSLYGRINPYVGYLKKDNKLYRIESLRELASYPLTSENDFFGEMLGEVKSFRVYEHKAQENNVTRSDAWLLHIDFENEEDLLYKVNGLNEQ